MKSTITTVAFLLLGLGVNAQTDAQLAEFQANNPDKLVMTRANYDLLSTEVQELIAATIVFKDEIGIGIFGIEDNNLTEVGTTIELSDVDLVKQWIAKHQDVKIVKRSEYNASRPDVQAMYDQPHILVLIGEELTKEDILNY